nr:gliding motility-associated C-terminal domain-containing protein [Chryseolinea lacunae]
MSITTVSTDVNSCAVANGSITPTVAGGSGTYTYQWTMPDATQVTTKNLTGLKAGSYTLKATDTKLGCTVTKTIYIRANNLLTVSLVTATPNTSCATPNGALDVRTTGGSGKYQSLWYDLETYGIPGTVEDLTKVRGGNYGVYVSDVVSGCSGYQAFVVAEQTVAPQFVLKDIVANTQCSSPFDGAASLVVTGTPGPYDIAWIKDGQTVSTQQNPIGLDRGVYGFTITDRLSLCQTTVSSTDTRALVIADQSVPNINVKLDLLKANTQCIKFDGAINVTVEDPKVPYSVSWKGPNNFAANTADISGLPAGNYTLTVEAGCNKPPVIVQPNPGSETGQVSFDLLQFTSDPDSNLDPNGFAIVDQPISQARASLTGHVLTIDYTGNSFKGTDQLRLRACDALGACTEKILTWQVDPTAIKRTGDIVVHNAVAPNSPGDNHYMRIMNLPPDNRVSIFNRWGDLVFGTQNYNDETPGKRFEGFGSDGRSLPSGTYFYKIEFGDGRSAMTGYVALQQ